MRDSFIVASDADGGCALKNGVWPCPVPKLSRDKLCAAAGHDGTAGGFVCVDELAEVGERETERERGVRGRRRVAQ